MPAEAPQQRASRRYRLRRRWNVLILILIGLLAAGLLAALGVVLLSVLGLTPAA